MPVKKLYVEGNLDVEVLTPILKGSPVVIGGGSKNSLPPRVRTERSEKKIQICYLRDRDFDFPPPDDLSQPTIDNLENAEPIGWRWCRHEIESYLVDPKILARVLGCDLESASEAILTSGRCISEYQAWRWTIAHLRKSLPPYYKLDTKPDIKELQLPEDLNDESWAVSAISTFRETITPALREETIQKTHQSYSSRFSNTSFEGVENFLLWFSGKDLMAGLNEWLSSHYNLSPGEYRRKARDWIARNEQETLSIFPEWDQLVRILNE